MTPLATGVGLGAIKHANGKAAPHSNEGNQPGWQRCSVLPAQVPIGRLPTTPFARSGDPFVNYLSITPIYDARGRLTHYVGIQSDVTELVNHKRAELAAKHAALQVRPVARSGPGGQAPLGRPRGRLQQANLQCPRGAAPWQGCRLAATHNALWMEGADSGAGGLVAGLLALSGPCSGAVGLPARCIWRKLCLGTSQAAGIR